MKIRLNDLSNKVRQELSLIDYPEKDNPKFVIQYHIRGEGLKKNEYVKVKENNEIHKRQIETLLEDGIEDKKVRVTNGNEFINEVFGIPLKDDWEDIKEIYERGTFKDDEDKEFTLYDLKTTNCEYFSLLDSSAHMDLRFEVTNDKLLGITLMDPGRTGDPTQLSNKLGMEGEKILCSSKAPEPHEWLTVSGEERGNNVVKEPGSVGATAYSYGRFVTYTFGKWEYGAIKPYYVEFFLSESDELDGRWNAREVSLATSDQKVPEGKDVEKLSWLLWKPEEQTPYTVSDRAKEKDWKPPEDKVPIPENWIDDNPEKFKKWKKWVEQSKNMDLDQEKLNSYPFKIKYVWWEGQFVIRGTRTEKYYLQIKTDNGFREWKLDVDPTEASSLSALEIDDANDDMWDYEGELNPDSKYNPNKEIKAHMKDNIKGNCKMEKTNDNSTTYKLGFTKPLGKWELKETTENSSLWKMNRIEEDELDEKLDFTVQQHKWGDAIHWDISLQKPSTPIEDGFLKFGLANNPISANKGKAVNVVKKHTCNEPRWFDLDNQEIEPKGEPDWLEGGNPTKNETAYVNLLDEGTFKSIDWGDRFYRLEMNGNKLDDLIIFKNSGDNSWFFQKPQGPKSDEEMIKGNPKDEPNSPFRIKKTDNGYKVNIFDERFFTSILNEKDKKRQDLPNIPDSVNLRVGKYNKPDTTGMLRIQSIIFDKNEWNEEKIIGWIENKDLPKWKSEYIKKD